MADVPGTDWLLFARFRNNLVANTHPTIVPVSIAVCVVNMQSVTSWNPQMMEAGLKLGLTGDVGVVG
jgi:hypothetical protein